MNPQGEEEGQSAPHFGVDLSTPPAIPTAAVDAVIKLLEDGRLFRYGEDRGTKPEAALLEEEFAAYLNRPYCVGLNSGGCAIYVALKSLGVSVGDEVLTNAFTLAPVPGAIEHAGAKTVLVDIDDRFVVDIDDLERKASASKARYFLLSYMRGHIPDMDRVLEVCERHELLLIEDCAHTMGAHWAGRASGTFGDVAAFSTQTFKHVNSGEGGLLVTADEDVAAKAILFSGSYMLYEQHRARPAAEVFERHRYTTPNCSMRMSNLVAALLRPQLDELDQRVERWREIHAIVAKGLSSVAHLRIPPRPQAEGFVPSSLQFLVDDLETGCIERFVDECATLGVHIKWFGANDPVGFTSRHDHWRYIEEHSPVPNADKILRRLCDLRLPLSLRDREASQLSDTIGRGMERALGR